MADRAWGLHLALLAALLAANWLLPAYHHGNFARIMVLATFAIGYNLVFGYTGLLSLGHALFLAAGMYGCALPLRHLGLAPEAALVLGVLAGTALAALVALLALRTAGVAFMIVTLMFAQAGHLTILYLGRWTRGDEGFALTRAERMFLGLDLADPQVRYLAAWAVFALALLACLAIVRSRFGRALVAVRENEERTEMLGHDTRALKFRAVVVSGAFSALAGALYALLFGYVGASFADVGYSILPLVWVLLGGAGVVLGPFVGVLFLFYLVDFASEVTGAYMLVVGAVLILLTLFAPQGILGALRQRVFPWLP